MMLSAATAAHLNHIPRLRLSRGIGEGGIGGGGHREDALGGGGEGGGSVDGVMGEQGKEECNGRCGISVLRESGVEMKRGCGGAISQTFFGGR